MNSSNQAGGTATGGGQQAEAKPSSLRKQVLSGLRHVARLAAFFLALATALGFLGAHFWFFDLFAHFRVQGAISGTILAVILFSLLGYRWGGVAAACAAIHVSFLVPFYFGTPPPPPGGVPASFRVATCNVNTRSGSPEKVAAWIAREDFDLLVLQEIDVRWLAELSDVLERYPHQSFRPRDDNFGIGLFSRFPLEETETHYLDSAGVPTLSAWISAPGGRIHVLATHPVPPIAPEQARQHAQHLAGIPDILSPDEPVLLLGDLNATPWGHAFRSLLSRTRLRDSALGFGIQPTWPSPPSLFGIPIDHCLHTPELSIHSREVGPDVGSDHLPLALEVSLSPGE